MSAVSSLKWRQISDVTTTLTEINYIHGLTSAIQTQLNAKPDTSEVNLIINNINGYTAVHSIIDSLLNGTYVYNGYRYRVQRDSVLIPTTLKNQLISVWELDETSGTSFADSKGVVALTQNGTVTVNQTGKIGKAILFDGTSGYLTTGANATYNLYSSWTISAWINPASDHPAGANSVIARGGSTTVGEYQYFLAGTQAGNIADVTSSFLTPSKTSSVAVPNSAWTLLTATYDGSSIKIYKNGILAVTQAVTGTIPDYASSSFRVGSNPEDSYFKGLIDQPSVWSRALTSTEADLLWNSGNGRAYIAW